MERPLVIAAPDGGLARAQAEAAARLLRELQPGYAIELDIRQPTANHSGLHDDHIAENRDGIRRLHGLLRAGEVDAVVHRGFDLRGRVGSGLRVACVLPRQSPYDALMGPHDLGLDELEEGARVGVVQLRSRAQLLAHRPDLQFELIAGDVGQWLTSLIDGEVEALVAPVAALEQLGLQERVCEIFPPEMVLPAPGSGVLCMVCRDDDELTRGRLAAIHDPPTAAEYQAEVAFLEALGGAWEHPISALAQCIGDDMALLGLVCSPGGEEQLVDQVQGPADDPVPLGAALAQQLLQQGAARLMHGEASGPATPAGGISGLLQALGQPEDPEYEELPGEGGDDPDDDFEP